MSADETWRGERVGKFTSSEISRLLKGGTRPMTDAELEEAKASKVRRTTVDTIFGDGAITYIKEVMHEILTGMPEEEKMTDAMRRGIILEPDAIQAVSEHLGVKVVHYGSANPKFIAFNDFAGGSPDGETEGAKVEAVIEVKCPNAKFMDYLSISKGVVFGEEVAYKGTHNDWLKDYNFDYYCQTQMNMMLTGRQKAYFVAYDNRPNFELGLNLAVLDIRPDKEVQDLIVDRIERATEILRRQLVIFGIV